MRVPSGSGAHTPSAAHGTSVSAGLAGGSAPPRAGLLFATSGHSGVDRIVENLLAPLGQRSVRFDLLTIREHGPYMERLPSNFRRFELTNRHRLTTLGPLYRYLRRECPYALLTASHRLNRAALIARLLSRTRARVVIRMGMTPSGSAAAAGSRRGARLLRSMRRWYPLADAVIVPSRGVGDDLVRYAGVSPEHLHVIPNPLVDAALHAGARAALDHPWFAPGEPPVILGAGSLESRKDFATLIQAFAELRRHRRARLVILGEGGERHGLDALAERLGVAEHLALPGYDANPYRWMARASVFALTSRREGSGAVLVEAMACGSPVVATDCPSGPGEILDGGRVGPLAAVDDSAAVAAGIERMLEDPPPQSRLDEAVAPFAVERAARRYLHALGFSEGEP